MLEVFILGWYPGFGVIDFCFGIWGHFYQERHPGSQLNCSSCLAREGFDCVVWMLELVAASLLLPWNCWLTEESVAPA
jgi:hypothetical protein